MPESPRDAAAPQRAAAAPPAAVPPRTGDASTDTALALLCAAVESGIRDLVLCPGSRSQALALVAAELERAGAIRLHVRIDERSAAFFALGLARESGRPVPVVVTSGTAVANLHPAMLEARHAGVPLIALTADRPPELIGIAANQATVQPGIFGPTIALAELSPRGADEPVDAAVELGRRLGALAGGPLHANVAFRDPLSGPVPSLEAWAAAVAAETAGPASDAGAAASADPSGAEVATADAADVPGAATAVAAATAAARRERLIPDAIPTLVLAGADAGPEAEAIAHAGSWPLLAEISSGARFGRTLVTHVRALLGAASPAPELRDGIRRVIVLGHPTLTRQLPGLVAREGVEAIVVERAGGDPVGRDRDGLRRVSGLEIAADDPAARDSLPERRAWLGAWIAASRAAAEAASSDAAAPEVDAARSEDRAERARFARSELAVSREPVDRDILVDAVWRASWPHDRLVVGASRLIRDLDERAVGKPLRVHASRGLAGIDGTIATALGVATASQLGDGDPRAAMGVTRALLGDLTFLHDASSLLVAQGGEAAPRVQLVVGNDRGGAIFSSLEVAQTAGPAFERVLGTPVDADLGAIARAYGWHHVLASTRAELEAALLDRGPERVVIEVPLTR